jgi:hypothetical protein
MAKNQILSVDAQPARGAGVTVLVVATVTVRLVFPRRLAWALTKMLADAHQWKYSSNQTVQPDVRPRADPGQYGGSLVHLQRHLQNGLI